MTEVALVLFFTLAAAVGYWMGLRQKSQSQRAKEFAPGKTYFQGLNFLLNEQPDKAVEEFVRLLEVNPHTFETHVSLGKLMRKQGQVDRAIRVHQNLLSRPQLKDAQHHQVHLELARDFLAAGLYDRAETLLETVIDESVALRSIAQRYLIDIYQNESEWLKAIEVANALLQSKYMKSNQEARKEVVAMVAHFYCQLAEEDLNDNDKNAAVHYIEQASAADKSLLRVAMLNANQDLANGRTKQAIKILSRLEAQGASEFAICLPILLRAYEQQYGQEGLDRFIDHVSGYLLKRRSTPVLNFLVNVLLERVEQEPQKLEQLQLILADHADQYASLLASNKLVELTMTDGEDLPSGQFKDYVARLTRQVAGLLKNRHFYRCTRCGFSGRHLHWRCPSCKRWETMKSIEEIRLS